MTDLSILVPDALVAFERVERPGERLLGVVCHVADELVVMQAVDDAYRFDGFMALPTTSLDKLEVPERHDAYRRVLSARGGRDLATNVAGVSSFRELLQRLRGEGFVTVYEEDPSMCWVGRVVEVTTEVMEMDPVQPNGQPRDGLNFRLAELRLVEWDTAYEEALRLMVR